MKKIITTYEAKGKWSANAIFLPDLSRPVVINDLTQSQIAAIPKDQYVVDVLGPAKSVRIANAVARYTAQRQKHGQRNTTSKSFMAFSKKQTLRDRILGGGGKEQTFTTLIQLIETVRAQAQQLQDQDRLLRRKLKSGNGGPPDSGIFYPPIDEDEMADCIFMVIDQYFHGEAIGNVCGQDYSLAQFCVLTHCFFRRTKLLQNSSQQPFCIYLNNKVFGGEEKFTVKTFNNYANRNDFQTIEPELIDPSRLKTNFVLHPTADGNSLKEAFQEIGWAFLHSEYFSRLKTQKENMKNFGI
jgi:hypothetical protein